MKKIYLLAAGAIILAGCNKNNTVEPPVSDLAVRISPVITKVTDTNFENGDKVGVSIVTSEQQYAVNQMLPFDGEVFTGDLKWYSEANTASTVSAYYPYSAEGVPTSFKVAADQRNGLSSSDFIAGVKQGVTPTSSAIVLPFKHLLTKLVLEFDNRSGSEITGVEIRGSKTTAAIDIAGMKATAAESAGVEAIKPFAVKAGTTYSAIVVPQKVAFELALTVANGKTLTENLVSTDLVGGGQYKITVKILPDDVKVSISGDIENWDDMGKIDIDTPAFIEYEEHEGYIIYKNEKYTTKSFSDGSTWMTQSMRYIPEGYVVSTDPADNNAHIWMPYSVVDGEAVPSEDLVEANGYLYDFATILGGEITKENAATYEGAQGICPNGWHVPTRAEYLSLCGSSPKTVTGPVVEDPTAVFWGEGSSYGSVKNANALGWNVVFSGTRMKALTTSAGVYQKTAVSEAANVSDASWVGKTAINYYASSTEYKANDAGTQHQFFALSTTFTKTYPDGRLSLMYAHKECGVALRCIKNK